MSFNNIKEFEEAVVKFFVSPFVVHHTGRRNTQDFCNTLSERADVSGPICLVCCELLAVWSC